METFTLFSLHYFPVFPQPEGGLRLLITPGHGGSHGKACHITAFHPDSCPNPVSNQQLQGSTELKAANIYLNRILRKPQENYKRTLKGSCKPACSPQSAELQEAVKHCHISLPLDLASCSGYDLSLLLLG